MSGDGYEFHADLAQNYMVESSNYMQFVDIERINSTQDKQLYVFDPAAMHSILVKNEPIYNMPDAFIAANHLMFGPCLVSTSGAQHRRARKIMNPVFSPTRLKEILPIIYKIAHEMSASISERLPSGKTAELDMLKILGTTALGVYRSSRIGVLLCCGAIRCIGRDETAFYLRQKRMIVPMQLLPFLLRTTPAAFRRWMINFVPMSDLHLARDLVDVMDNNSRQILAKKTEAIAKGDAAVMEQVGQGKDIMSLLMRASDDTTQEDRLSEEEFLGQMNVIIFAGTDTTSTAVSRALQELAIHPEIQDQLREEVTKAAVHGDLDYDTLCSLPLLEAVSPGNHFEPSSASVPLTMTAFFSLTRMYVQLRLKDAVLPLERPMVGLDQTPITEIFVPAGTIVHIGIKAANTNCAIWGPDAREWKPSRWLAHRCRKPSWTHKFQASILDWCIGFKFAEMSMKVLLAVLIKDFVFALSDKKIVWKLGQAEAPSVGDKQMLPMMVSSVRS
ncbi:hypothetical protein MSAN_00666600 [Mycena sanguinolenta]|uniref:Cytochrome P450 n=1 Tax=Mycena sanguinolenta TaxID=230812 RepID=A0A8H6Z3W0_9AGAR|nr:hypothetical protein MSAN_00666600 [Mycena sanguinolenta]